MGNADYLRLGDWNARCDRCGRKRKGSELRKQWNGWIVCPEHWEPRHPQEFVRAVKENPTPPFVRNPTDVFAKYCTLEGRTGVAGYAVAGCAIVGRVFIDTSAATGPLSSSIPGIAIPGYAIAGAA